MEPPEPLGALLRRLLASLAPPDREEQGCAERRERQDDAAKQNHADSEEPS